MSALTEPNSDGHLAGVVGVVPQVGARDVGLELAAALAQAIEAQIAAGLLEALAQGGELGPNVALLAARRGLRPRHGRA